MELWEQVYESMVCHVLEEYRIPGVEDAFADDAFCMQKFREMRDAYDRLCERLGVVDEDADVECIIRCYEEMQLELCKRMFFTVRIWISQKFYEKTANSTCIFRSVLL